jgi:hypothetical protein
MKTHNNCFSLLNLLCALLFVCVGLSPAWAEPLLVVSGDLRGEIKPCGCAEEGDMGGLQRRGTLLAEWRQQHDELLYLDLGNNFPEPSAQGHLKLKLIQQAFHQLTPDVILPGPHEWNYGLATWDTELPYLLSNTRTLPVQRTYRKTIDGQTWEVWGFVSPSLLYQNENETPLFQAATDELLRAWEAEMSPNAKRVLLFRGTPNEAELFQKSGKFERILVGSTNDDELHQVTEFATASVTLQMIPTKGQGLFHGQITQPQLEVRWLRRDIKDWGAVAPLFAKYDAEVKEMFLSGLKRMNQHKSESPFVGNAACSTCHAEAHASWEASAHSTALATLAKIGKDFDPECLECHVVGLHERGFLSTQLTPHLANVQCENCHGPARAHLKNPLSHPPRDPRQACASCHQGSHSPTFDFSTYWPQIQHK